MSCEYPTCDSPASCSRVAVVEPDSIFVNLCAQHAEIVDRNHAGEHPDFWRWFSAMSGLAG